MKGSLPGRVYFHQRRPVDGNKANASRSAAVGKGTLRGSRVAKRAVHGENTRRQRGSDSDVDIPLNKLYIHVASVY